jgi:hypothetical protein
MIACCTAILASAGTLLSKDNALVAVSKQSSDGQAGMLSEVFELPHTVGDGLFRG